MYCNSIEMSILLSVLQYTCSLCLHIYPYKLVYSYEDCDEQYNSMVIVDLDHVNV